MWAYNHPMTQEQIRVSPENWKRLNALKEPGDTFNDVIDRLLEVNDG